MLHSILLVVFWLPLQSIISSGFTYWRDGIVPPEAVDAVAYLNSNFAQPIKICFLCHCNMIGCSVRWSKTYLQCTHLLLKHSNGIKLAQHDLSKYKFLADRMYP